MRFLLYDFKVAKTTKRREFMKYSAETSMLFYLQCTIIKINRGEEMCYIPLLRQSDGKIADWITIRKGTGETNAFFTTTDITSGRFYEILDDFFTNEEYYGNNFLFHGSKANYFLDNGYTGEDFPLIKPSSPQELVLWVMGNIADAIDYNDIARLSYPWTIRVSGDGKIRINMIAHSSEDLIGIIEKLEKDEIVEFDMPFSGFPEDLSEVVKDKTQIPVDEYYVINLNSSTKANRYFSFYFDYYEMLESVCCEVVVENPENGLRFKNENEALNYALTLKVSTGFVLEKIVKTTFIPRTSFDDGQSGEYWTSKWKKEIT